MNINSFITVTSPNGGEDWQVGSSHDITWNSAGTSGTVHIEYSTDNGSNWTEIIASTPDDGTYPWAIPDTPSDNCLVRIIDTDGSPSDIGNAVFTISLVASLQIVSVNPVQNALDISKSTNISVTFSQNMNSSTINDSTFIVHSFQTGLHSGTYSYDAGTRTATFSPDDDFIAGEIVYVILTTDIEDATGDTLISPYEWSFTIEVDGGSGEFAEKVDFDAGDGSTSVFSSDLDSDGDMDLAVANLTDIVSVLMNNGNGTFATKVDYGAGDGPYSVFSSDLDGDGDMDLAVANGNSDNVSVLMNNGNGTFAPKVDYSAEDEPRSVFSSDLDGDGDMDLAVANLSFDNVSVLLSNGNGTFAEKVDYGAGDGPQSIFSSDLDGDGDMDLAVATVFDIVSVLMNNGNGTFATKVDYGAGDGPQSIFSSDLDGDGDMDLAVANYNSDNVSVLLNNGDGTFAPKVDYGAGDDPCSVFSSDLDGDGDMDLAVANRNSDNVSVLLNNGDGTFAPKVDYGAGETPYSVFSSDLDGDGDMDLAVANLNFGTISVLLNKNSSAVPTPDLPKTYSMSLRRIAVSNKVEIIYAIPERASIKFRVYDIKGAKIEDFTEEKPVGFYSREIDMSGKSAGIYFLKMEATGKKFTQTSKFVLM